MANEIAWISAGAAGGGQISAGVGPVTAAANGAGHAIATLNGTTSGRSLILLAHWSGFSVQPVITSITVSGESNMTVNGTLYDEANTGRLAIASLANITTGGNKTIDLAWDINPNGSSGGIWVMEYAGGDTTNWFNVFNSGTGTGANPSINLTTTAANCHIISIHSRQVDNATAGSGYTIIDLANMSYYDNGEQDTDYNCGAAGTKTVDYSAAAATWATVAAAFKPA